MPTHWTYDPIDAADDLAQGDIIARGAPVLGVLNQVHKYFCDPKYLCYLVITQSCDLVIRGESCKARYITLPVVRSLEGLIPDVLDELCDPVAPGVYPDESKYEAQQFLNRLLNQNEQAHGIFYLHPDADVGIAVPAVAMLRVSIALRSREHYSVLKAARSGRLGTSFRNKLGWLAGNLFSRVDTPDWADRVGGEEEANKLVSDFLDGGSRPRFWVSTRNLRAAERAGVNVAEIPSDQVAEVLQQHTPSPAHEVALSRVREKGGQVLRELNNPQLERFLELAREDHTIPFLCAARSHAIGLEVYGREYAQQLTPLLGLADDDGFRGAVVGQVVSTLESFRTRRGPRLISVLIDLFSSTFFLGNAVAERVRDVTSELLGPDGRDLLPRYEEKLRAEQGGDMILERCRGIIYQVLTELAVDKLVGRLENDAGFRGAFKPV